MFSAIVGRILLSDKIHQSSTLLDSRIEPTNACLKTTYIKAFPIPHATIAAFFSPPQNMPSKHQIARRFARALPVYEHHAAAQLRIAQKLAADVQSLRGDYGCVLEIGCGSGVYTRLLQAALKAESWHINDLCPECSDNVAADVFLAGDIETLPLTASYDLITSASAFQWLADPDALLRKLNACLKENGLLAFNTFDADNLYQIKNLTGAGLHYPTAAHWAALLQQNGFELISSEAETITLWFDDAREVLAHLKHTGVTATAQQHWTRARLHDFAQAYRERYQQNGRLPLSYTPLYFIARKTGGKPTE